MLFSETSKAFKGFPSIPSQRIFLETDDTEHSIYEVYEKAAKLRGADIAELKKQMQMNFKSCFNIAL